VVINANGQLGVGSSTSFFATPSVGQTVTTGTSATVVFDTATFNNGSAYNTGTSFFTAPANGIYQINVGISVVAGTGNADIFQVAINGTPVATCSAATSTVNTPTFAIAMVYALNAFDLVNIIYTNGGGSNASISGGNLTYFSMSSY